MNSNPSPREDSARNYIRSLQRRDTARQKANYTLSQDDLSRIESVLRATGRYALMLRESSAMTPTVIADIEARGMAKPWDRIAARLQITYIE